MDVPMRVVVIGGFGNFGARICRRLAGDPRFEILASGRSPPATAPWTGVRPVRLDLADPGFGEALSALAPQLVIHCAGPYQGQDYRVAAAAMAADADYLDLADGREFVLRFSEALLKDADCRAYVCGLKSMASGVLEAFQCACMNAGMDWPATKRQLLESGRLHIETC